MAEEDGIHVSEKLGHEEVDDDDGNEAADKGVRRRLADASSTTFAVKALVATDHTDRKPEDQALNKQQH